MLTQGLKNNRSVFLVEDNEDDVALMRRAFVKARIANPLEVFFDGEEAMERLLDSTAALPTLILLDLKLPKMNGLEVLKALRENPRTKLVPVVMLTSSKEESDLVASYSLGANSFVRKPVEFDQFVEAMNLLGLYWLLLNEQPKLD